jgi:tetratricopeptide (TPR) repeat protein
VVAEYDYGIMDNRSVLRDPARSGGNMGHRYPQPDNEDEFEQQCLRLYRKLWKNENLKLYAKRGERQDGIDIFDPLCLKPVRAVQCKHYEPSKTIPPSEIVAEVEKAEQSPHIIEHYVIATTAKKSRNAQDAIAKLNQRSDKKFTVDIHFWEEICQHVSELGRIVAELIIYGENILAGAVIQGDVALHRPIPARPTNESTEEPYFTIEKLLNERRFDAAHHELDKLPDPNAAKALPLSDQYKLLRLHAKLELELGGFDVASTLFLKAFSVAPELDQAKANQVFAYALLGDTQKAYELAKHYVHDGVTTAGMIIRLIESATSQDQLQEHASVIQSHLDTDDNINVALAQKYIRLENYTAAGEAAERALRIAPDSPHAHFVMAMVIHTAAVNDDLQQRPKRLHVALEHYDAAIDAAREKHYTNLLPEILSNRATVRMLFGDLPRAAADYVAAVESSTQPSLYAVPAIRFFLHVGDFENAKSLLTSLDSTSRDAQYLTLVTKHPRSEPLEKRKLIEEMSLLAEQQWDSAIECRFQCVQWSIELKDYELAESYVPTTFRQAHPFQAHIMLAWIRWDAEDCDNARAEAAKALGETIKSAHPQEIRILAQIFVKLKDDANAVGLLEQVTKAGVLNDDMKALIVCAQRLGRHDLLLRLCRELRASQAQDDHLRRLEVQLLSQYAPRDALQLADEFIRVSATPWYFIAAKNLMAVRLEQFDKLNFEPTALPTPSQLSPAESYLTVIPYIAAGKYAEGLKFIYAQLRLNFENEQAHGGYLWYFLTYGHRTGLQEPPATVENGCAILLKARNGDLRWIVLEDEQPAASRGEFAAHTEYGQLLIGRSAGDIITLPGNPLQQETATIIEVQSRFVRIFQDSIQHFVQRFPGTSMLQQVHVGSEGEFDPSVLIKSLKGRQEHGEKCVELYRDHPCSLHLVADHLGISEFDFVKALAQYPSGIIKCCQALPTEFDRFVGDGVLTDSVVLGISAIVTLTLTNGWEYLDPKRHYLVSQLTSDRIDSWIHSASDDGSIKGGELSLDVSNRLVFRPITSEERASRYNERCQIKALVRSHCEIVSSIAVAHLAPDKRKLYADLIGIHNTEAICIAKDRNAMLWVDDFVVGFVAKSDFGVVSVWTQLILRCFARTGSISMGDFNRVTAKLAAWKYTTTVWNVETIVAAGNMSGWRTDIWPFPDCIRLLAEAPMSISEKTRVVVDFLRLFRRCDCPTLRQTSVIQAILTALGDAHAVRWILNRVDQLFAMDFASAQIINLELSYWLRFR